MHWLVSQSIFLVIVKVNAANGDLSRSIYGRGYSCIAIFFVIITGVTMLLVCIGFGFRRFEAGMPDGPHCSMVISAACHRPADDVDAAVLPVMWGMVKTSVDQWSDDRASDDRTIEDGDSGVGHWCFTSHPVVPPIHNKVIEGNDRLRLARPKRFLQRTLAPVLVAVASALTAT